MRKLTSLFTLLLILTLFSCKKTEKQQDTVTPFTLANDILWASPKGFDLTMDIYTPNTGKDSYPVIVMFHGGGWLINNKSIMNQASEYLATHGEYVVCNVNYRLLGDLNNTTTINEIVEDAFGAMLWVKENIKKYKGDPQKLIVTGDSAGGHIATMITTAGHNISSEGFNKLSFNPTWLPVNKTADDVANEGGIEVQAAIISYGGFDLYGRALKGFETKENIFWTLAKAEPRGFFGNQFNAKDHPEMYKAVSPLLNIPNPNTKKLPPMLFTAGSKDTTTPPESILEYVNKLKEAGYSEIEYWVHEGRPHAFLDSGSNEYLGIKFEDDAIPALNVMIEYLNKIFYK